MKIRSGFVSNSSTSSFCIYGAFFDFDEIKKIAVEAGLLKDLTSDQITDMRSWEVVEFIENNPSLSVYSPEGFGGVYIGKSLTSMKDDQTFGDFKKETKALIEKELKKSNIECGIHKEAYAS